MSVRDPRGGGTSAWVHAIRERQFGNPTAKLLMMVLADYVDADDECWAEKPELATEVEVSERLVTLHLGGLERDGVISRVNHWDAFRGRIRTVIHLEWAGLQRVPLVEGVAR